MKKDEHFSEEQLNAFIDGELDPEEKSRLFDAAENSEELDRLLCKQRKLKELIEHAYDNVPPPQRPSRARFVRSEFLGGILVAGILLVIGISGGLVIHSYLDRQQSTVESGITAREGFILHVASGELGDMRSALATARHLLSSTNATHARRVEIVANERGLDLLRSDVTPFADEIRQLFDNDVVFYACSRTIERLEERGVHVSLVPEARPEYTALDRIVLRMKDGWEYIKI